MQYKQCSPTLVPPTIFYHSRRNPHSSRKIPIRLFVMPYRYFLLMTNIERSPDGMTRFGTIIRNNAQLILHTHLKQLPERYTIKTKDILSYMGIIIDVTILSNIHRNRQMYTKKRETASKGKQYLFLSYKILLYYSSVQRSIV